MQSLKDMDGVRSVTMTTNGLLLSAVLPDLVRFGIDGINVSIDTLDASQYACLTGGGNLSVLLQALKEAISQRVNIKVTPSCWRKRGIRFAIGGTSPNISYRCAFHRTHAHRLRDDLGRHIGSRSLVPSGPGLS